MHHLNAREDADHVAQWKPLQSLVVECHGQRPCQASDCQHWIALCSTVQRLDLLYTANHICHKPADCTSDNLSRDKQSVKPALAKRLEGTGNDAVCTYHYFKDRYSAVNELNAQCPEAGA